jgi:hypothetical protein
MNRQIHGVVLVFFGGGNIIGTKFKSLRRLLDHSGLEGEDESNPCNTGS